jgi:hypothetical protein
MAQHRFLTYIGVELKIMEADIEKTLKNIFQTIFGQLHSQMAQRVNIWDREGIGDLG